MREPRPDWSPLGVNFKILDEHPYLFYISSPPLSWSEPIYNHFNSAIILGGGGGGVLQISSDEDDRIGAKIKTQPNP